MMSSTVVMIHSESLTPSNKSSTTRYEKPPFELSGESKRLQNNSGHCCCSWLSPEVEAKSLLLKTSCTSDTGIKRIELDLTQKPFAQGLSFIIPEGALQDARRGKKSYAALMLKNNNNRAAR